MKVNLQNFSISFTDGCRKCYVSGFGTVSESGRYLLFFNFKRQPFRKDFELKIEKAELFLEMSQDERTKLATEIKSHVKEHILKAIQKQLESVKFD